MPPDSAQDWGSIRSAAKPASDSLVTTADSETEPTAAGTAVVIAIAATIATTEYATVTEK